MSENATSYEDEGTLHNDQASKSLDVGQEDSNSQALCLEVLDMSNHGQPLGASSQDPSIDLPPRAQKMAKLLRDKRGSRAPVMEKMGTLQLLDLPMDILKEIVKEVTHTNDLTSLALTHSALHNLAIPHIYSRFDIVWPEGPNSGESRSGVDALTFGLSTLVMSEDVFGEPKMYDLESKSPFCYGCGTADPQVTRHQKYRRSTRSCRIGNSYGQHTRKFSVGNGPMNWVQDYLISKEAGKMLGTLVALAVARMPRLETFIWDMPTGVLREIWRALSLVEERPEGPTSRLEKIWIRCHDNRSVASSLTAYGGPNLMQSTSFPTAPSLSTSIPAGLAQVNSTTGGNPNSSGQVPETILERSYRAIEHPNFSILPPLRSITVLNIDEPAYLVELSVLVERSIDRLRELRIGAASTPLVKSWLISNHDNKTISDSSDSKMHFSKSGGMLGLIMSKFYDCRKRSHTLSVPQQHTQQAELEVHEDIGTISGQGIGPVELQDDILAANFSGHQPSPSSISDIPPLASSECEPNHSNTESASQNAYNCLMELFTATSSVPQSAQDDIRTGPLPLTLPDRSTQQINNDHERTRSQTLVEGCTGQEPLAKSSAPSPEYCLSKPRKLRLETLELEKVPITVPVLQKTIDWSVLTSLTLLTCESDEEFWKALRRTYSPRLPSMSNSPNSHSHPLLTHSVDSNQRKPLRIESLSTNPADYQLKLKKIHTNNVSLALISFLKEALAPNSLEWLFLQDGGCHISKVTVDTIYRGPLRRHRGSLKKLMIDSSERRTGGSASTHSWKKWMLNREILSFITGGKMPFLRELAVVINYKDWHFFLQRLPQIPHVRSLYIPRIADHIYGSVHDARELALQVVDIIALRPEIELCYFGISTKCYEILENRQNDDSKFPMHDTLSNSASPGPGGHTLGDLDEDSDVDDEDNDDDDDDEDDITPAATPINVNNDSDEGEESDASSDDDGSTTEDGGKTPTLILREILFYDDKVSIFKARHGRL